MIAPAIATGNTGSTHGEIAVTMPAKKAIGIRMVMGETRRTDFFDRCLHIAPAQALVHTLTMVCGGNVAVGRADGKRCTIAMTP